MCLSFIVSLKKIFILGNVSIKSSSVSHMFMLPLPIVPGPLYFKLDPQKIIHTHARAFMEHSFFELVVAVDQSEKQRVLFKTHYDNGFTTKKIED